MAKNLLETTRNVFLTGQAGTGKTYLLNDYIASHPDTLVCSSTGSSAVAIGGTTMHRLFSIPVASGANPFTVQPSKLKVFENAETVIIDEISMARADVFAFAIQILKRAEKLYGHKIRLIVSGDFAQLPPVVRPEDEKVLKRNGFDPSGFAFTTPEWDAMKFKTVELTDIHRQQDKEFLENLGKIRRGDLSGIAYFDQFVSDTVPEDATILCGTNAEADMINQAYLEDSAGKTGIYFAKKEGYWADLPAEENLVLKEGLNVMFIANDIPREGLPMGNFQNGQQGVIKELKESSVIVETKSGLVEVFPYTWYAYEYKRRRTGIVEKEKTGTYKQLPLKIAKAITIHKSQGKTLEKVVISPKSFAAGMLYVALSRASSPEGLILTEPIEPEYVITDKKVRAFIGSGYTYIVPEAQKKKRAEIIKKQQDATKKKPAKKSTAAAKKKTASKKTTTKKAGKPVAKKPVTKKRTAKPKKTTPKTASIKTKTTKKNLAVRTKSVSTKKKTSRTTKKKKTT